MNQQRVDHVVQYILAIAGQEDDPWDRELGPIHVLKYAYLADLAYADRHDGETFTGSSWRFWSFGPWDVELYKRIEPAAVAVGAEVKRLPRKDEAGEYVRYLLVDEGPIPALERELPSHVVSAVRGAVKRFKKDTSSLLDYVYQTKPMLRAAPGEFLSFAPARAEDGQDPYRATPPAEPTNAPVSKKEQKRRLEKMKAVKQRVAEMIAERRAAEKATQLIDQPPPRYDEVYQAGVEWLDSLAGERIMPEEGILEFTDDVWKAPGRGGPDVAG